MPAPTIPPAADDERADELQAVLDELSAVEVALNRAGVFRTRPDQTLAEMIADLAAECPAKQLAMFSIV